jgi:hypothetical protein
MTVQIEEVIRRSEQGMTEPFICRGDDVPVTLQQDVLVFDWWVRNTDRMLTHRGGNPNLLWQPESKELVVIDQNQAFDPDFDPASFANLHVFADQWNNVVGDLVRPQQYNERFQAALDKWESICNSIPAEWFYIDAEMTIPVDLSLDLIYQILKRYERDDFWML